MIKNAINMTLVESRLYCYKSNNVIDVACVSALQEMANRWQQYAVQIEKGPLKAYMKL